jgi:hypothetical protein
MEEKLIESLLKKDFVLDCPKIILTQSEPSEGKTETIEYSGAGTIAQEKSGEFLVKVFCGGHPPKSEVFKINRTTPGKIIPKSEYYVLSAVDTKGSSWQADVVLPQLECDFSLEDYMVSGHFEKLRSSQKIPPIKRNHLSMYLMSNVQIPCNTVTESKTYVGKEERGTLLKRNVATFESCGLAFEITKEDKWLVVSVRSESEIKNWLIIRIMEALQFVLGYYFTESIVKIMQGTLQETRIRTHYKSGKEIRNFSPLRATDSGNEIWDLFSKYLEKFITYEEERWHPTYGIIHSVIQSGFASVEAQAITVAVAVEGLLKREFSDIIVPCDETKKQIAIVDEAIKDLDIHKIKNRLLNALNGMKNVSAADQLYELKNRNLIEEEAIRSWKKLRNTVVHGHELDYQGIQKYLDLHRSVLVLFYQLVFLTVGYTGHYTDYTKYGFPVKPFDKKMV